MAELIVVMGIIMLLMSMIIPAAVLLIRAVDKLGLHHH
jgi:type II secretory pathway pseudopilin PulG